MTKSDDYYAPVVIRYLPASRVNLHKVVEEKFPDKAWQIQHRYAHAINVALAYAERGLWIAYGGTSCRPQLLKYDGFALQDAREMLGKDLLKKEDAIAEGGSTGTSNHTRFRMYEIDGEIYVYFDWAGERTPNYLSVYRDDEINYCTQGEEYDLG